MLIHRTTTLLTNIGQQCHLLTQDNYVINKHRTARALTDKGQNDESILSAATSLTNVVQLTHLNT